ncbi:MAG: iron-sulfur cluster-binding protein [Candidatus Krumholzibacteriia bacterium]
MNDASAARALRCVARLRAQRAVSASGLRRLELELPRPLHFAPGQFAMVNLAGPGGRIFARPFSILASEGAVVSLLYRVVGGGTGDLAAAPPGTAVTWLGPLGRPFPPPAGPEPHLLLAGGVGLPPLLAWQVRHGGPDDLACFGARDVGDVPWDLLAPAWQVAVDVPGPAPAGRTATPGTVVARAEALLAGDGAGPAGKRLVLACGPLPMLRAAAALAAARGWACLVSVEERMGCGYGVCRGCVVPTHGGGWLTACGDGPVLDARDLDWDRFAHRGGVDGAGGAAAGPGAGGCGASGGRT